MVLRLLLFLHLIFLSIACGRKKVLFTQDLNEKSINELVNRLDELSQLEWEFLSAKTNVKMVSPEQSNSFKASLRMKRDSAMLVNISFAGIPIVQALISKDSLKLVNRKDKCFIFKDKSALDAITDIPLEYAKIQDLLIGKPLLFDKSFDHIQIRNNDYFEVKTTRQKSPNSETQIHLSYYLSKTNLELNKVKLESPQDQLTLEINYHGKHEKIEGLMLPQEIIIVIDNPKGRTTLQISYNKPDISHEKKITLNVPENYVICP
jgi:hypothetical protein